MELKSTEILFILFWRQDKIFDHFLESHTPKFPPHELIFSNELCDVNFSNVCLTF